jgi:two-component system, NtrC family, response regulator AtoC
VAVGIGRAGRPARTAPSRRRVLVVDDAEGIRSYLKDLLAQQGFEVLAAENGERALEITANADTTPDAVILDVLLPGIDGLEVLRRLRATHPRLPVIMLSVVGKASTIVECMSLGAADFLNKPFEEEDLEHALRKVLESDESKLDALEPAAAGGRHHDAEDDSFVWSSKKMQHIHAILEQVADADVTVLIHGESGVGKDVISRELHKLSNRREHALVKVNCAALPEELLESELFGYERGAFTGASARKPGKFEIANGGTMFLDEIGEMSAPLQAKLLQVLQDGQFSRLGGQNDVQVDVRVLCATNRNLEQMVAQGTFREDLYYRINVVSIPVPPLRERREEIPGLIEHFLRKYNAKYQRDMHTLSPRLMQGFTNYAWPGNIRELENMVKRIVVLQSEDAIAQEVFEGGGAPAAEPSPTPEELVTSLDLSEGPISLKDVARRAARNAEREALRRVLYQTNWNRKKAAKILDVSYKTLLQKIKECGLSD